MPLSSFSKLLGLLISLHIESPRQVGSRQPNLVLHAPSPNVLDKFIGGWRLSTTYGINITVVELSLTSMPISQVHLCASIALILTTSLELSLQGRLPPAYFEASVVSSTSGFERSICLYACGRFLTHQLRSFRDSGDSCISASKLPLFICKASFLSISMSILNCW